MEQLYILYDAYQPSTAGTNHLLAYAKGIAEHGVSVTVFYLCPDNKLSKASDSTNLSHVYLWEQQRIKRFNKYSTSLVSLCRFMHLMKRNIPVFIMGVSVFLPLICMKRHFKIYHERTEHPEVSGRMHGAIGNVLFSWYKKALLKLDGLFVISENLRKCFVTDYRVEEEKVHVINMVVDANRFSTIKKKTQGQVIAYCGTASNNKDGVDELIKAFSITIKKHPESRLKIIGKTPDKGQAFENARLVEKLGIIDKVEFLGIVSYEEMPQMLTDADILALDRPDNQQAKYGFPTKLGEYLLTGNPVVVTKVGDIPNFLTHGINAMLAQPENPQDFSDKICWLIEHPVDAASIGASGRDVAMREFNYKIESQKVIEVIFGTSISK